MGRSLSQRKPGRPEAGRPAARGQVLDALTQLLDSAPMERPSLRAVAQASGVTPALLHYHFGDLPGLMNCLVRERAAPQILPLQQELRAHPGTGAALGRFLSKWTALTVRRRWLLACALQSRPEDAPLLSLGSALRIAVAEAQRVGDVRKDLPDHYIALLLLSLGAMPHLSQTLLGEDLDRGLSESENVSKLTLRHLQVLQTGVARS